MLFKNKNIKTSKSNVHTDLRSVLSKDANKSVGIGLQAFLQEPWPEVLGSVRHLSQTGSGVKVSGSLLQFTLQHRRVCRFMTFYLFVPEPLIRPSWFSVAQTWSVTCRGENKPNIKTEKKGALVVYLGDFGVKERFHHLKLWDLSETPRTASCCHCTDTLSGCCCPPSARTSSLHPEDTRAESLRINAWLMNNIHASLKASLPWCPQSDTWGQRATGGGWAACWGRTGSQPPRPTARWWPRSGEARTATGEGRPWCCGGKKHSVLKIQNTV